MRYAAFAAFGVFSLLGESGGVIVQAKGHNELFIPRMNVSCSNAPRVIDRECNIEGGTDHASIEAISKQALSQSTVLL